jgi:hypothetical protein
MARKPRKDRRAVASNVIALRLDPEETAGLDRLIQKQNGRLRAMQLPEVVTRAVYLRSLIRRELMAVGLMSSEGEAPLASSLPLLPPRKRPHRSMGRMPTVTIERTPNDPEVPQKASAKSKPRATKKESQRGPEGEVRRTFWERLVEDEPRDGNR